MRVLRTIAELRAALAAAARPQQHRARSDDGLLPRGAPVAHAPAPAQRHRSRGRVAVRESGPVRAGRGPGTPTRATRSATSGLAEAEGVDVLFAPPLEEVYPEGFATTVNVAT